MDELKDKPYRLAVLAGSTSLFYGTAVFLGWKITRHIAFPMLGPIALIAGLFMVSLGLISMCIEWYKNRHDDAYTIKAAIVPLTILLANFPVAAYYVYQGTVDLGIDSAS